MTLKNLAICEEKIHATTSALEKLMAIAGLMEHCEFRAVSITPLKDGIIHDFYIPEQTVREARVKSDGIQWNTGYAEIESQTEGGKQKFLTIGVAHGHGNFGVEHSSIDHNNFPTVLKECWANNRRQTFIEADFSDASPRINGNSIVLPAYTLDKSQVIEIQFGKENINIADIENLKKGMKAVMLKHQIGEVSSIVVNRTRSQIHGIKRFREVQHLLLPNEEWKPSKEGYDYELVPHKTCYEHNYTTEATIVEVQEESKPIDMDALIAELHEKLRFDVDKKPTEFRKQIVFFPKQAEEKPAEPEEQKPKEVSRTEQIGLAYLMFVNTGDPARLIDLTGADPTNKEKLASLGEALLNASGKYVKPEPAEAPKPPEGTGATMDEGTASQGQADTIAATFAEQQPGEAQEASQLENAVAESEKPEGNQDAAAPVETEKPAKENIDEAKYHILVQRYNKIMRTQCYAKMKKAIQHVKKNLDEIQARCEISPDYVTNLELIIDQKRWELASLKANLVQQSKEEYAKLEREVKYSQKQSSDPIGLKKQIRHDLHRIKNNFDDLEMNDYSTKVSQLISTLDEKEIK
jgi:hypothetical protein